MTLNEIEERLAVIIAMVRTAHDQGKIDWSVLNLEMLRDDIVAQIEFLTPDEDVAF